MAELATIARPYANAAFAAAKDAGELELWSRSLQFLAVAAGDPRMQVILEAPEVADSRKVAQLLEICGDEANDRFRKFVHLLADNKRLGLIVEINEQFEALKALEQRSLDVEVTSAFPLSPAEETRLRDGLRQRFAKDIQLSSQVDASLIGGAIIRAGDTVIDGSVQGKLQKLAESIQRA